MNRLVILAIALARAFLSALGFPRTIPPVIQNRLFSIQIDFCKFKYEFCRVIGCKTRIGRRDNTSVKRIFIFVVAARVAPNTTRQRVGRMVANGSLGIKGATRQRGLKLRLRDDIKKHGNSSHKLTHQAIGPQTASSFSSCNRSPLRCATKTSKAGPGRRKGARGIYMYTTRPRHVVPVMQRFSPHSKEKNSRVCVAGHELPVRSVVVSSD